MTTHIGRLELAGLQTRLDGLAVGGQLALGISDCRRLFGVNDLGHARLDHFAAGHGCKVTPHPSMIIFQKLHATSHR